MYSRSAKALCLMQSKPCFRISPHFPVLCGDTASFRTAVLVEWLPPQSKHKLLVSIGLVPVEDVPRREIIVRRQSYGWRLPKYWPPPHPPHHPASIPRLWCAGRTDSLGGEGGWGFNILEDAKHSSVLYVCKSFLVYLISDSRAFCCRFTFSKTFKLFPKLFSSKSSLAGNMLSWQM